MLYLHLAWRNLWRNKRRTLISVGSIVFAVMFALITRSMQLGSYAHMIQNVVRLSTGYMQVHADKFWTKQSIDLAFSDEQSFKNRIAEIPHVTDLIPRLQTFTLAASTNTTRGALVSGIDPLAEDRMNGLRGKLVAGAYPGVADSTVLIAEGLARYLGLGVGDTVVLYGQGYHGATAAEKFVIGGIVRFPMLDLNSSMVYLALPCAQRLFGMPGLINSLSVMLDHPRHQQEVLAAVQAVLGDGFEVMSWQEMMPEVVQGIEVDNAGGVIMILILYIIIGFGIFGTIMMMTLERRREFGVLIAVGMSRVRLVLVALAESVMLSLLGVFVGTILSVPLLTYAYYNPIRLSGEAADAMVQFGFEPILPFSLAPSLFVSQMVIILAMALVCTAYPVLVIRRLEPVSAMRT
jgi:ABC-type lipoprotein release transport system permease subunit